jgi:hypothetical protein
VANPYIIFGGQNVAIGASTTTYVPFFGSNSDAETRMQHYWLVAGVFRNLRFRLTATPTAASTITVKLRINEADTGMSITFNPGDIDLSYTGSDISVASGDRVCFQVANTGSGGGTPRWCVEFEPTSGSKSIYGCTNTDGSGSTPLYYGALNGFHGAGTPLVLDACKNVFAAAGTITDLTVILESAPGGGTHVFSLWLSTDGGATFVQQNGAGGTQDTRVTYSGGGNRYRSAAFSLAVAAGDIAYITYERTAGGGINVYGGVGIVFDPTTSGQFIVPGLSRNSLNTAATDYLAGAGAFSGVAGTVSNTSVPTPITTITLSKLRVWLVTAPGSAKSYQFDYTLDESTSPVGSSPTVTISGTTTPATGTDATNTVVLSDTHRVTLREVPSGSPTSTRMSFGAIGTIGGAAAVIHRTGRVISWGWG